MLIPCRRALGTLLGAQGNAGVYQPARAQTHSEDLTPGLADERWNGAVWQGLWEPQELRKDGFS